MSFNRLLPSTILMLSFMLLLLSCQSESTTPQGKNTTASQQKPQKERGKITRNEDPPPLQLPTLLGHYPAYAKNANLYEVNLKTYTAEGTINAFIEHIPRLQKMGIDVLTFLPVFNANNLMEINPELGTLTDFRRMVKAIHKGKMKILLTFDSIKQSDFESPESKKRITDAMRYWISQHYIEGYTLTNTTDVSIELWKEIYSVLINTKQDLFVIATDNNPKLMEKNYFHADTDQEFNALLHEIAKTKKGPTDVVNWYKNSEGTKKNGFSIHSTSTAKQNSTNGPTNKTMGPAHDALAALAFTIGGIPLMSGGQEEPLTKKLALEKKGNIGFDKYLMSGWYQTIFKTKHMNQALWNGDFGGEVSWMQVDDQILSYQREKNGGKVYCLFNLSNTPATFESDIEVMRLQDIFNRKVVDLYKGTKIPMEPWSYRVFSNY